MFDRDGMFHCLVAVIHLAGPCCQKKVWILVGGMTSTSRLLLPIIDEELQYHEGIQDVND
jgi:hypothetical protein